MNKLIVLVLLGAALCFTSCEKEAFMSDVETTSAKTAMEITEQSMVQTLSKEAAIFVYWGKEGIKPVVGANVFNEANELVGTTDQDGYAYFDVKGKVQTFRVVEPNYGRQQASLTYPTDFKTRTLSRQNGIGGVATAAAGWTINSGL